MTKELLYSKPQICLFDISEEVSNKLKELHFKCYDGSLGPKIEMGGYRPYESKYCIINRFYPINMHEFDIFVFDLGSYKESHHIKDEYSKVKTKNNFNGVYNITHPTTFFDQRPFISKYIGNTLKDINSHPIIVILFSSRSYEVEYEYGIISKNKYIPKSNETAYIYELMPYQRLLSQLSGTKMSVQKDTPFFPLFNKHITNAKYNQSFSLKHEDLSLISNIKGESVSLISKRNNITYLILPQFENKTEILTSLLTEIFPQLSPEVFPESAAFSWTKEKEYFIPNHEKLLLEKSRIEDNFSKKLIECEKEIEENLRKFEPLFEMIKETDDKLVKSVIIFLKWLGFVNVKDMDSEKHENAFKEEDIQIDFEKGLLVLEVKGISGYPTDADCSQISKVKLRRCKERNKFDVFALFVVNHQRFLPPLKRSNLANEETKINDAVYDERGIVSTWQLFNLYFEIENGVITKDEARERLLEFGLINFRPKSISLLCKVEDVLKDGFVFIAILNNQNIKVDDTFYIEKNDRFAKCKIISIQLDGKDLSEVNNGEVGIKIDIPIKKNSLVYFLNKGK